MSSPYTVYTWDTGVVRMVQVWSGDFLVREYSRRPADDRWYVDYRDGRLL